MAAQGLKYCDIMKYASTLLAENLYNGCAEPRMLRLPGYGRVGLPNTTTTAVRGFECRNEPIPSPMAAWGLEYRDSRSIACESFAIRYKQCYEAIVNWTPAAVRRLRKKIGVTQEEFARRLHVSFVTVNRWEHGHSSPRGLSEKALDTVAKKAS